MRQILVLVLFISLCLFGCAMPDSYINAEPSNMVTTEEPKLPEVSDSDIYEYIDEETGVHYLIYSYTSMYSGAGGMTPRLNADGSVMVNEVENK